ncbi:MAG: hypothetical protein ACI9SP_004028 [Arenicella sp.]|jgi:hypothetical protein
MNRRFILMPDKLWLSVPTPNRSKWIRGAIRQRLARDSSGLSDDYLMALNESSTQLRKVGINLSQVTALLHIQKTDAKALPISALIVAIRASTKDIQAIKRRYLSDD